MQSKIYSYLGLAMRAGKLSVGDEGVLSVVRSGEAKIVILASDASPNAKKKYENKCLSYQVPIVQICDRVELGKCIGKEERVVVAVTDAGFAKLIRKCLVKPPEVKDIE